MNSQSTPRIQTFGEFYYYYLSEHRKPLTRASHFFGTFLVFLFFIYAIVTQRWLVLAMIPLAGYGFAWVSHAFIERNKPATFTYPLWSLGSDFVMFWHILTGKIKAELKKAEEKFPR